MRTGKQDAVTFIDDRETRHFDSLTHTRGDEKLVLGDRLMRVKVTIDKSRNRVSKAMRAGETVAISQRMTVDAELQTFSISAMVTLRRTCILGHVLDYFLVHQSLRAISRLAILILSR